MGGTPIYRINWKRLLLFCGLAALVILALRGCVYAKKGREPSVHYVQAGAIPETEREVLLYHVQEGKTMRLTLEEYLLGVVAAEMPASFHEQALCAQAVAARTFTLKRMEEGACGTSGCDMCTDSGCCQAYDTPEACREKWGREYNAYAEKIRKAVETTRGEVLCYNGELIEALYHAAAGGYTENSENVFSAARPYLRSVKSELEAGSSHLQDTETLSRKEFVDIVNKAYPKAGLKEKRLEEQVQVKERYESGRVKSIRLGAVDATGREFRSLLELRSAMFTVAFTESAVIIQTKGYGHGVGMSQAGANGMAEQGAGYREILYHYYTGTAVKQFA